MCFLPLPLTQIQGNIVGAIEPIRNPFYVLIQRHQYKFVNMNQVEHTSSLHHPRPTIARAASSNPSGSSVIRPGIRNPTTPVQRPQAPAPSSPDVRVIAHNINTTNNGHAYDGVNTWKNQPPAIPIPERYTNTSPTVTRRSGRSSSNATSPTYVDEHVITYPEMNRSASQVPAVLRQRSASSPEHIKNNGAYAGESTPPRKDSIPVVKPKVIRSNTGTVHFTPDNLFVSLTSAHTLKIFNLTPSNNGPNAIMESVRRDVLAAWPPGIKADNEGRGQWTVRFNTNIWTAQARQSVIAAKMITALFSILAVQGYSYLCSIQNTGLLRAPRHLFTSSPPSPTHFFSLSFSLCKNKLRFMDAPHDLNVAVSNALKHATLFDVEEIDDEEAPRQPSQILIRDDISEDEAEDDIRRVYTYRLTKRVTVARGKNDVSLFLTRSAKADMLLLLSQLLKIIASCGYRLDASVPLGRVGPFGLRGRREIWIFKAVHWKT